MSSRRQKNTAKTWFHIPTSSFNRQADKIAKNCTVFYNNFTHRYLLQMLK